MVIESVDYEKKIAKVVVNGWFVTYRKIHYEGDKIYCKLVNRKVYYEDIKTGAGLTRILYKPKYKELDKNGQTSIHNIKTESIVRNIESKRYKPYHKDTGRTA